MESPRFCICLHPWFFGQFLKDYEHGLYYHCYSSKILHHTMSLLTFTDVAVRRSVFVFILIFINIERALMRASEQVRYNLVCQIPDQVFIVSPLSSSCWCVWVGEVGIPHAINTNSSKIEASLNVGRDYKGALNFMFLGFLF